MVNNTQAAKKFKSLEIALAYVARHPGRYLFPIKPGAKFPPLIKNNLEDASNNPAQLRAWVAKFGEVNWGLAHRKSRVMVADVDTNEAKGKVGADTHLDLDLEFGWPETEKTTTPSGGFHLIYEALPDETIPMALGENGIGRDIDVPNYTLIAGSTLADGTAYIGNGFDAVPCPQWIYDKIKNSKSKSRITDASEIVVELDQPGNVATAIDYLQEDAPPSIEGQNGDLALLKAAYYLKDLGISQELGADLLNEYFNPRCEPAWDLDDLAKKMAGAYAYSNLSKVGGKTAEAEFADVVEEPIEPMGIYNQSTGEYERQPENVGKAPNSKPWDTRCAVIVNPASFADIKRRKLLSTRSFDNLFGHIGGSEAHKKAVKSKAIKRYDGVGFRPIVAQAFTVNGQSLFNMYQPHDITPLDGKPTLIIDHIRYLIPDPASRRHFVNWLAWLVQKPDRKLMHAVLLLGNKRTGKSLFGELMKVILGAQNCSEPSKRRVASDFNGWLANKRLVIIHELREKGARGLYDELKEVITQPTVSINLKGIEAHEVESFAGLLTITNHDDAIPIDDQEGRYLVIRCADAPRYGKGTPASSAYYENLFASIGTSDAPGDEARRFYRYLLEYDISNYNGQGTAPETEAKSDMVEAARNPVERFVSEKIDAKEWPLGAPIINPADVLKALPFEVGRQYRTEKTVEAALREAGCKPLKDLGPLRTGSGRKRLWALDGSTVQATCALGRAKVIKLYDAAVAARTREEDEADAEDARTELANDAAE